MFNPERFNVEGGEVQEKPAPLPEAKPDEIELRKRESELKARYEDPYRNDQAGKLWAERKRIKEKEKDQIEKLTGYLQSSKESLSQLSAGEQKPLHEGVQAVEAEFQNLVRKEEEIQTTQKNRSIFQKLKYRFVADPIIEELKRITIAKTEQEAKADQYRKDQVAVQEKWKGKIEDSEQNLVSQIDSKKAESKISKSALLAKTHAINSSSREAIRNTFVSMEKGELDIARLAKQENAIVVHTIPLDGWTMGNTQMNNKEIDIKKTSAKEKGDILFNKIRPDVSASVLSVDRIEKQEMYYPFGYILDGKLIGAYEGDEGTYADGTARRRKEEYRGTLEKNTKEKFETIAHSAAKQSNSSFYNESIVHAPSPKGIIIDEVALEGSSYYPGDTVREIFSSKEEEETKLQEYAEKYGKDIIDSSKQMRDLFGIEAKTLFAQRKRSGLQKAVEFAQENHPELPIYVRKTDGVYTLDGKKVTAEDIYA
jgi:hypothetical protein